MFQNYYLCTNANKQCKKFFEKYKSKVMLFSNVKLKYKLYLKLEHLLLKLLLKLVLRQRKRSDCGVSSETLGIHIQIFKKICRRSPPCNMYLNQSCHLPSWAWSDDVGPAHTSHPLPFVVYLRPHPLSLLRQGLKPPV